MSFDQNSKFDPNKGYGTVKFGARKPVLETELNELQEIQNHARAEIYRAMVHSGVLEILGINGSYSNANVPNGLLMVPNSGHSNKANELLLSKTSVVVNGYQFPVQGFVSPGAITGSGVANVNNIKLPEPPTEGTRDDLIFLEAWFEEVDSIKDPAIKDARIGEETSRRTKLNWRIRTVAGVDFNQFAEGFPISQGRSTNVATPQGGNAQPLDEFIMQSNHTYTFRPASYNWNTFNPNDKGLHVSGNGGQASKDLLKTADGYVYAIPLFRVKRRNSGGYSQNNGNGARNYYSFTGGFSIVGKTSLATNETGQIQLNVSSDENLVTVGDEIVNPANKNFKFKVLSKDGGGKLTVQSLSTVALLSVASTLYVLENPTNHRPDGKYANIIHQDDIIDLRHKVSLTGVNYDQLLEENFDKLLRGELRTKEGQKMLKTYHGVPKTPIDANHVFYASFDGTTVPEKGTVTADNAPAMEGVMMPTGVGATLKNSKRLAIKVSTQNAITVDMTVPTESLYASTSGNNASIVSIIGSSISDSGAIFSLGKASGGETFRSYTDSSINYSTNNITKPKTPFTHLRIAISGNTAKVFVNGRLELTKTLVNNASLATDVHIGSNTSGWGYVGAIADLSISNIDRGANFATLPKDFIDGYAVIDKAFNMQRRNLSDAQTSQYTTSIAKPKSQVSDRGITVEKGTGTNLTIFETGDKIKVKGIAGEIITGVIDTDTALARVVGNTTSASKQIIVDDVSKLAINDTIRLTTFINVNTTEFTITAIDSTTKTITINTTSGWDMVSGQHFVMETTASTSSPVVKFGDGDTVKTVVGTWTNLGTNEATFTLGENVNLDTEDVFIEYSLNSPNGQGGIPEVLTEVLEGQYLGQKYVKGAPVLKADFREKVLGSTVENPHKAYRISGGGSAPTLLPPTHNWVEDNGLEFLKKLDGTLSGGGTTTVAGSMAQKMYSFDLIAEVERQFGRIPKATKAEKAKWVAENLSRIIFNWHGYGVSTNGNKATLKFWFADGGYWNLDSGSGHTVSTASTVTKASVSTTVDLARRIDANGFVHFLAYAEPSDGVTPSVISTDYVELEIEFKSLTGYDTLTPAEPFHNGTQKNFFFIRKETKEIEMMFNCDEDYGVVTWGNYVPNQWFDKSIAALTSGTVLGYLPFLTTMGTGALEKGSVHSLIIGQWVRPNLPVKSNTLPQLISENLMIDGVERDVIARGKDLVLRQMYAGRNQAYTLASGSFEITSNVEGHIIQLKKPSSPMNYLAGIAQIYIDNGELFMYVRVKLNSSNIWGNGSTQAHFKLQGSPLVKGV